MSAFLSLWSFCSSIMSDTARSPARAVRPAASGGAVRQRRGGNTTTAGAAATRSRAAGGVNNGGLWRFYTEDSTGLKIGPVPVLVLSLVFIASVFVLHIWGKYTRASSGSQ
ncbi:Protein transport protein Sec61 subunit beta [Aphelenchoides besseyi]|nr:Protein transport protein Sec61 subunit beta [Aphelenchoides besseyi]